MHIDHMEEHVLLLHSVVILVCVVFLLVIGLFVVYQHYNAHDAGVHEAKITMWILLTGMLLVGFALGGHLLLLDA